MFSIILDSETVFYVNLRFSQYFVRNNQKVFIDAEDQKKSTNSRLTILNEEILVEYMNMTFYMGLPLLKVGNDCLQTLINLSDIFQCQVKLKDNFSSQIINIRNIKKLEHLSRLIRPDSQQSQFLLFSSLASQILKLIL